MTYKHGINLSKSNFITKKQEKIKIIKPTSMEIDNTCFNNKRYSGVEYSLKYSNKTIKRILLDEKKIKHNCCFPLYTLIKRKVSNYKKHYDNMKNIINKMQKVTINKKSGNKVSNIYDLHRKMKIY